VAQQLLDKLRALDKQAQRKETLSFNATEQYLADQDVQKLLTQLYDNVQVTWYDTLDNTLRNNQDLQTPLLRALQRAHPQVQQIDFEKPVSQGMNDCGVLTVKIVSDFLRGEQPVLAKQHVDQDNIKALRYTHYQQCPGIQARQQRADLYHSKQDGSGQIQSTTDIRQQVKTLTNQVPSIASAFQSFTDTTLDINRCFDETVKGINDLQNISEEQRQQMLNTMQIIYNTVPNALHFVYQRIMPGAHYMDKLQSAKSEFNYNARKARRIMQVRDGAIALGSLFFGVSEIAETSGFSICTIFDDSVCKDATVIASQASRYICLIVFGGIAIIANRVGQNYDKEAKVKKQELMHTENKTSLTELVNQVDQQSPFATSQADNQQKQNSQNSQDNQQPVQQLLGYMGFK